MRTLSILLSILLGGSLFFSSCKKEDLLSSSQKDPIDIVETSNPYLTDEGIDDYIIAQNYLFRVINIALAQAFLTPELGGFYSGDVAETRSCPTSSIIEVNNAADTLLIDFGTECLISNTDGTVDTISGELRLYTFIGIQDTFFIVFDELKCNNTRIRFQPGEVSGTNAIKFGRSSLNGNLGYNAFIDGAVGPSGILGRSQFQIINCSTFDSTVVYPQYSGQVENQPSFNFFTNLASITDPFDPDNDPGTLFTELLSACYSLNPSPFQSLFYDFDGTGYQLTETYNVSKASSQNLLYKPTCRWMFGGSLQYNDIPAKDINYGTCDPVNNPAVIPFIDNPFQQVWYGHDGTLNGDGTPDENANNIDQCDPFVRVFNCDQFLNGDCSVGEEDRILECD